MYTGLVSLTSMEIILNFITVLTVLILVFFIVTVRRMSNMKKAIEELRQENAKLQAASEALPVAATPPAVSEAVTEPIAAAPAEPAAPETPAASAAPAVETSAAPAATGDGPAPEVVAAIVAAIASCGFGPETIRSIRPHRVRSTGWIMAGRMANMR